MVMKRARTVMYSAWPSAGGWQGNAFARMRRWRALILAKVDGSTRHWPRTVARHWRLTAETV